MRTSRLNTENLTVHHMTDSSEWMPIPCVRLTEGTENSGKGKAVSDGGIRVNIDVVVVVNEIVEEGSAESPGSDQKKGGSNDPGAPLQTDRRRLLRFWHGRYFSGRAENVAFRLFSQKNEPR